MDEITWRHVYWVGVAVLGIAGLALGFRMGQKAADLRHQVRELNKITEGLVRAQYHDIIEAARQEGYEFELRRGFLDFKGPRGSIGHRVDDRDTLIAAMREHGMKLPGL